MNKNKKSRRIAARLCAREDGLCADGVYEVNVSNLRPGARGALVPVGAVECLEGFGGARPLCRFADGVLLGASGRSAVYGKPGATPSVTGGAFAAEPQCALATGADSALAMCATGAVKIKESAAGAVSIVPATRVFPAISLTASAANPVSVTVAARTLSKSYSESGRLSRSDADAVADDLVAAYLRLASQCAAAGFMIQPAIARYRLIDGEGNCVFTSAPVLLSHSSGAQCAGTFSVYSTDRRNLEPYEITARTWTLEALLPAVDSDAAARVSRADVYMTPLFHPYVPGAGAEVNMGRGASASEPFLRLGLPGFEHGLGNDFKGHSRRLIMEALARLDSIESRVAVIASPFAGPQRSVAVDLSVEADAAAASTALQKALGRPVKVADRMEVLLSEPHSFTAACAASDAGTTAWADLTVQPFKGYPAGILTSVFTETAAWQATTRVTLASGAVLEYTESHVSPVPLMLNPIISYPRPDAVSVAIAISSGGITRAREFALTPDGSGRHSVYVGGVASEALTPGTLATGGTQTYAAERFADAVAVASTSSPLIIDSVARLGGGAVKALVARGATDQAWEFGRCRFIAGTAEGIYSVGVGTGRKTLSCRRLTALGVSRADALCATEGGETFALAEGETGAMPVLIASSGRVSVFAPARNYIALAYDFGRGELWAVRADDGADVFCRKDSWRRYRRTGCAMSGTASVGGEAYGISSAGLWRIGCERAGECDIAAGYSIDPSALEAVLPTSLEVCALAESFKGSIGVAGADAGAGGRTWPLLRAGVEGAVRSPLRLGLVGRPVRRLRVTVEGRVSSDFTFSHLDIFFKGK